MKPHGQPNSAARTKLGGPLNDLQLKLLPRLLLASLTLPGAALLHQSALWLYPDGAGWFGFLWYEWVPPFYDIPFALLVLAPFITTGRGRWIRVLALLVVTAFVYLAAVSVVFHTQWALDRWIESRYLRFVTMVPTALVATVLLAAATAWLGPLRISRRYWICTGLAGLVSGLAFLTLDIVQNYTGNYGDWFGYVPYWLWPVATCLAIDRGRERERTS